MRGGHDQVAARRMHDRTGAHVQRATVDEYRPDAPIRLDRTRDGLLLGLAEPLHRASDARGGHRSTRNMLDRTVTRRQQRRRPHHRAEHQDPNAHRFHHA
jgi:hypothetical protein